MIRPMILGAAVMCVLPAATAEPVKLNPGNWSMSVEIKPDGGNNVLNSQNLSQCMKPEDASLEPTDLAKAFAGGPGCVASNVQQSGNQVTFEMTCPDSPMGTGFYTLIHNWNTFSMKADQTMVTEGKTIELDVNIEASRIGACS